MPSSSNQILTPSPSHGLHPATPSTRETSDIGPADDHLRADREATVRRVRDLERYLTGAVLCPEALVCEHEQACRASHAGRFYEGQLHHIGRYYDLWLKGRPLRIVVVGQEYGGGPPRVDSTLRYAQVMESGLQCRFAADGQHRARNPHMRGTTSALRLLFGKGLGSDYASELVHFEDGLTCHLFDAFALANYLLCSAVPTGKGTQGRSTRTMRENCARHFRGAMEILAPTVVIVQGKGFASYVERAFDQVEVVSEHLKRARLGGTTAWVATFTHPSARHPHNWGANDRSMYLRETVCPTLERIRRDLLGA